MKNALELERLTAPLVESGYLLDEGFLLHERASDGVAMEARDRHERI